MMKITSALVGVGRRCVQDGRDRLSQIASFDEQAALTCVTPPMFPPSYSTGADDVIFLFLIFPLSFWTSHFVIRVFAGLLF